MNFLYFASKNPFRNKLRTFFVIMLLTLGIMAIVGIETFSVITNNAMDESYYKGGADINLYKDNISAADLNTIKGLEGVQDAVGVKVYDLIIDNETSFLGTSFSGKDLKNNVNIEGVGVIKLISGSLFGKGANEIILTKDTAKRMNKSVGDIIAPIGITDGMGSMQMSSDDTSNSEVTVKKINQQFKIVGIIDNIPEASVIMPIQTVNNIFNNTSESGFSYISLKAKDGQLSNVETLLNTNYPEFSIAAEESMPNQIKNILLYLTLFFTGIGAIIMIITTLKYVGERTREIGVLKAIGWTNRRVMGLILVESFIQFILAVLFAIILLAIILLYINSKVPDLNSINYLKENMMVLVYILGVSFAFSILMPVLGCLIPLVRVARLKPTEALKYE